MDFERIVFDCATYVWPVEHENMDSGAFCSCLVHGTEYQLYTYMGYPIQSGHVYLIN